jgi:hypothetical protein
VFRHESEYSHCSLERARENFAEHGAMSAEAAGQNRAPRATEERDPNWPYGD